MLLSKCFPARPRGFSLIELVVVIAMIALMIGLVVPATQKARDAADSKQSLNNLKQLGFATHNLNNTYKLLPPGIGFFPRKPAQAPLPALSPGGQAPSTWGNVFYFLLPYLEEDKAYKAAAMSAANVNAKGPVIVPVFIAPGDPSLPPGKTRTMTVRYNVWGMNTSVNDVNAGLTSYAANGYVFCGDNNINNAVPQGGVAIAYNKDWLPGINVGLGPETPKANSLPAAIIPRTFADGTSYTILFMEKYAVCGGVGSPRKDWEVSQAGFHAWSFDSFDSPNPGNYVPLQLSLHGPMQPSTFARGIPNQYGPSPAGADCKLPQGLSTAGICVGLADGSARMIKSSVSGGAKGTWPLLLLPNDGTPVPGDWK